MRASTPPHLRRYAPWLAGQSLRITDRFRPSTLPFQHQVRPMLAGRPAKRGGYAWRRHPGRARLLSTAPPVSRPAQAGMIPASRLRSWSRLRLKRRRADLAVEHGPALHVAAFLASGTATFASAPSQVRGRQAARLGEESPRLRGQQSFSVLSSSSD